MIMKQYISEDRAIYEDMYHGQFSRKLAAWAINHMETAEKATGARKPIMQRSLDDVMAVLKENKVELCDECVYTAWYLFNMAIADYPKALPTDAQRAYFVEETINDPDGNPANTLDCFVTKMCNAGMPIYWERMV